MMINTSSTWLHSLPAKGSVRYDPVTSEMQVWDGSQWRIMTSSGAHVPANSTKFIQHNKTIILVDYVYWADHEEDLETWLDANVQHGRHIRNGMVLEFNNMEDLLVFTLKWS